MPRYEELDWRETEHCSREQFTALMTVSRTMWQQEVRSHERYSSETTGAHDAPSRAASAAEQGVQGISAGCSPAIARIGHR